MHTPAGYRLVQDGNRMRAEITDFWAMVFNPSSMERLVHVLVAALILGAFTGIAAFFGAFMNWNYIMDGSASTNAL